MRRSASSVTKTTSSPGKPAPIAKPVRRSKSQVNHSRGRLSTVTSIQHGGPVTFVSVNRSAEDLLAVEDEHQQQHHQGQRELEEFQGSHTLPRAGAARKNKNR